jgi:hypothetical protein
MGCHVTKLFRFFSAFLFAVMLSACGGGGGSSGSSTSGSGSTKTPDGKITIALVNLTGNTSNLISGTNVLIAKALVTNDKGTPAVGIVVTFTLDSAIATLLPISGTSLTDANGIAQVNLAAGVGAGAGTVTASATVVGTTLISDKTTFSVGAPISALPAAVNFVSGVPSDKSIVIKGAGGNGRTEVALLTFKVVDSSNIGIANRKVNFVTQSTEVVTLISSSGISDSNGNVVATINSGDKPTAVRVLASVDGTAPLISTLSDTVTVTTGLPTQASFNLLREKVNVEGFDFGNIQNKITALLADASGGVVANGTQIVFTADSGAIIGDAGTTDTARCLTTNGTCSVTWRSESPNKSVVTVTATAVSPTAPGNSLTTTISFTNSASSGTVAGLPAVAQVFSASVAAAAGPPVVVAVPGSCGATPIIPIVIPITVLDRNGYTMPDGTVLSAVDPVNAAMTIFPATVAAPSSTTVGGTAHELRLSPVSPCPAGLLGHVYLQVKSALGIAQIYRIDVKYQ